MASQRRKEPAVPQSVQSAVRAVDGVGRAVWRAPGVAAAYVLFGFLLCFVCPYARAGVGVVLNESLHESMDRITGTGHTAVYLSSICPESPVKLRLCRLGESGSVMSVYINIGEEGNFAWNIVPLNVYLYGVEDPANRPIFGSYKIKHLLEERYLEQKLPEYCTSTACRTSSKAEWREMVAATLIRSVYIFAVDTTVEQDRAFIEEFNAAANKNHFNGITRNCADFTRQVINRFYPGAVKRDALNDFGMTSPKAVARTFTHYALTHPELNFRVMHFAQVPGTIPRSSEVRAGTEQLYRSKKLLVPMAVFAYQGLPVAAGSYLLIGRFNPEHAFETYADVDNAEIFSESPTLHSARMAEERQEFVGSASEWKEFDKAFESLVEENKSVFDRHDLSHFFKELDRTGTASLDSDGSVWMVVLENGESLKVGLSANNALAHGSEAHLAYKFLLARTAAELKSPRHRRETMREFKEDWSDLQRASVEVKGDFTAVAAASSAMEKGAGTHAVLKVVEGKD